MVKPMYRDVDDREGDEEQNEDQPSWWELQLTQNMNRMLLIAVVSALLGQVPIPLGEAIGFTIGPMLFYFTVILWDDLSMFATSTLTILATVLLRMLLMLVSGSIPSLYSVLLLLFSASLHYYSISFFGYILSVRTMKSNFTGFFLRLLLTDMFGTLFDVLSRGNLESLNPPYETVIMIFFVALFRSALVVTFYYIAQRERIDVTMQQEKAKYEQLLMLLTGFYTEAFFLRKSSADIESTMARCYALYRTLHERSEEIEGGHQLSQQALDVAKDIHEIKKDYQRIVSGMNKLIKLDTVGDRMPFGELVKMILASNQSYSQQLQKHIRFRYKPDYRFLTSEFHSLISILNNLISNAVEAIDHNWGEIIVSTQVLGWHIYITVQDNGPGIDEDDQQIIFAPGYTTKFSGNGMQSTGIGLTHVKSLVTNLEGEVKVSSQPGETIFTLIFPRDKIECPPEEAEKEAPLGAGNLEVNLRE